MIKWYYGLVLKSNKSFKELLNDALKRLEEKEEHGKT